ncbi:MAG: sulfatase-like hydrolase/transferase [Chitinophagaceae bacterium]|nr:sulfatase-like hydrolase/transferase [Chitinophagaceae bacterium]
MGTFHFLRSFSLRLRHCIKTWPAFLFLLPLFFVLHGITINYNAVPYGEAIKLTGWYILVAVLIAGICWLFYRDRTKAAILSFFIMAFHFFFGNVQDSIKSFSPLSFFSQYRFLLPVGFCLLLAIMIMLNKRKRTLHRLTTYLNILLLLLALTDTFLLITMSWQKRYEGNTGTTGLTLCDTCPKPDIYLLLFDQYAGHGALKEVFGFDNSGFENELQRRGFHVVAGSRSNYNLTPFSMASLLEMDYLSPEMGSKKNLNVGYSYRAIQNSRAIQLLNEHGYRFYNHSVFDFPGQPAHKYAMFFPYGTKLITSKTFVSRIARDIRSAISEGKLGLKAAQIKIAYEGLHFNNDIFEVTKNLAATRSDEPKFVYAHFMMPHFPYYFDSKGHQLPLEKLLKSRKENAEAYIEYLQYCNTRILELAEYILARSPNPPVIMLLSDHGFRHPEKKADRRYDFMNFNAIYLPGKNYHHFHDSLTSVNHFRVFFNSCFNQRFPLLKDSTIDLWD